MVVSPSSTSTGSGTSGGARGLRPGGASSGGVRQRRTTTTTSPRARTAGAGAGSGLLRFYSEDSPGLKVGPVPVLVMSLIFIASVFVLHIWGKYTRS